MNETTIPNFQKIEVKLPEGATEENLKFVKTDDYPIRQFKYKSFTIRVDASQYVRDKYNTGTLMRSTIINVPQGMYRQWRNENDSYESNASFDGNSIEPLLNNWIPFIDHYIATHSADRRPASKPTALEQRALRAVKKANARIIDSKEMVPTVIALMNKARRAWEIRESAVENVVETCGSFGLALDNFPVINEETAQWRGEFYLPYWVVSRHLDWLCMGDENVAVDEDSGGVWMYLPSFDHNPDFQVVTEALTKDERVTLTLEQLDAVKAALIQAYIAQVEKVGPAMHKLYSFLILNSFNLPIGTDPFMWDTLQFGDFPINEHEAEAFICLFNGTNVRLIEAWRDAMRNGATLLEAEKALDKKREEVFPSTRLKPQPCDRIASTTSKIVLEIAKQPPLVKSNDSKVIEMPKRHWEVDAEEKVR